MTRVLQTALLLACSTVTVAGTAADSCGTDCACRRKSWCCKPMATGSQIYTCKPGTDGALQWVLKAPDADLHDKKGAVIGHHFAGPSWKHKDGSEITGKASAHVDSPECGFHPVAAGVSNGSHGEGMFAKVTTFKRINTQGGKAPAASECDASKTGTESKSAYSADYYFYAPGK